MAPVAEVNKSEAIRQYIKSNRKARTKDVVAALKEQGIDVSPQAVSTVRTRMLKKKAKRKGRLAKEGVDASNGISKAQAIRDTFDAIGLDTAPKEVVGVLAGRDITVSSAQVIGIRNKLQEKRKARKLKLKRRRKANASGRTAADSISLDNLIAVKLTVQKVGSVQAVRSALAALEKLR